MERSEVIKWFEKYPEAKFVTIDGIFKETQQYIEFWTKRPEVDGCCWYGDYDHQYMHRIGVERISIDEEKTIYKREDYMDTRDQITELRKSAEETLKKAEELEAQLKNEYKNMWELKVEIGDVFEAESEDNDSGIFLVVYGYNTVKEEYSRNGVAFVFLDAIGRRAIMARNSLTAHKWKLIRKFDKYTISA